MTYSEVKQLRRMAVEAGLDGANKLKRYSIEDLKKIYNGYLLSAPNTRSCRHDSRR